MNHPTQQHPRRAASISSIPGLDDKEAPSSPAQPGRVTQIPGATASEAERKLILTLEGKIIREYPIKGRNLSIGRKHGNDIQLNDLTLSGRHALISIIPDYVFIEDLGSTNGTMVNGNHIKKVALEHGDIIQVGHHQLTYLCETEHKYEPTMFIKAEFDETQFIYADDANENTVKGLPLGGLRTVEDTVAKPVMELRKTYNTIGFHGKRMALITRGTKGYSITSVISTRSRRATDIPLLNGAPLSTDQNPLKEGDIINIAGFKVQFYYLS
jgi:pSer/pThr/pTyr-binding forkhead associated (FHA) protein